MQLLCLFQLPPRSGNLRAACLDLAVVLHERLLSGSRRSGPFIEGSAALVELLPGVVQRLPLLELAPCLNELLPLGPHRLLAVDQVALELLQLLAVLLVEMLVLTHRLVELIDALLRLPPASAR